MAKVLITIEAEVDDNLTLPYFADAGQYELPITEAHAEMIDRILLQEIIRPKSSIGTITWTTVE